MKKITMFYLRHCPHCNGAMRYEQLLTEEYPAFADIPIERIEENENPDIAGRYDYYFVPTYYVDGIKVHEGKNKKEDIEKVFRKALS